MGEERKMNTGMDQLDFLRSECEELKRKNEELRLALEHNEKVHEDKERRSMWEADMRFRDGYIKALKYALVCVASEGRLDRKDYEEE